MSESEDTAVSKISMLRLYKKLANKPQERQQTQWKKGNGRGEQFTEEENHRHVKKAQTH